MSVTYRGPRDELNFVMDKLLACQSSGKTHTKTAAQQLSRYRELLQSVGQDDGSIMLQDHWSLLCEIEGDWQAAVEHRQREIELVNQLFEIDGPVGSVDNEFLTQLHIRLQKDLAQLRLSDK